MAALQEIERLLDGATPAGLETRVMNGAVVPVAAIGKDVDLVYGAFSYQSRAIGTEGRLLTLKDTCQPVFAVRKEGKVTPLPYAEDVKQHPLCEVLVEHLEILNR